MVFLIFTRANLYLGINGRITELLPFGEIPYLSLAGYSFPDDMIQVLEIVHKEVEAYFDRTAFGMPSNIGLLAVFSEGVDQAIKLEIHNEFSQILPAGWIWESGLLDRTDHLDSESEEELPISFRRLIKSLKTNAGIQKQVAWNMSNSVNVQMLEQLTIAPHKSSPVDMLKAALPAMPSMPAVPSISLGKYLVVIPNMLKRIDVMTPLRSMRRTFARLIPTMPSRPVMPKLPAMPKFRALPQRKYLMVVPAVIIVVALGALVWPDGGSNQQRINKDQDLITSTAKGPLNPPRTQMVNNVDSSKQTPLDTLKIVRRDSIKMAKQLTDASNPDMPNKQTSESSGLIAANDRVNNGTNRSAEQPTEKPAVKDSNETNSNTLTPDNPEVSGAIGIKTSNTDSSEEKSTSSLSLSEYAHHSRAASFPGGEGGMIRYIAMNSRYPKLAKRKKIIGTVVIRFEVDVEGRIANPTIVKSVGYGCDEEAIRVVRNMPLWKPATQLRKRISSTHTVSVPFN
ncbi:MAG: energy transducer TonB [Bacteroidia bacterium]